MLKLENIEAFLDMLIVYENQDEMSAAEIQDAYEILRLVKVDLIYYIKQLMGNNEHYIFSLKMPIDTVSILYFDLSGVDFEVNYFPFGTISSNVWIKLKEDPNNPVFRVIRFLSDNIKAIRGILRMYNVPEETIITKELLDKAHIFDLYGLYAYETFYKDVDKYLRGD